MGGVLCAHLCEAESTQAKLRESNTQLERSVSRLERALEEEDEEATPAHHHHHHHFIEKRPEWWGVYKSSDVAEATKANAKRVLRAATERESKESAVSALKDMLDLARKQFEAVYAETGRLGDEAEWANRSLMLVKKLQREVTKQLLSGESFAEDTFPPELRTGISEALRALYEAVCLCARAAFGSDEKKKDKALKFGIGSVFEEKLAALKSDVDAAVEDARRHLLSQDDDPERLKKLNQRFRDAVILRNDTHLSPELQTWLEAVATCNLLNRRRSNSSEHREIFLKAIEALSSSSSSSSERAIRILQDLPPSLRDSPESLTLRAAAFYAEKKFSEALKTLNKAATKDSNNPNVWFCIGLCLEKTEKRRRKDAEEEDDDDDDESRHAQEILGAYERCLALDSRHAMAHNNFGSRLLRLGDVDGAEREYKISIDMDSASPVAHNNLATLLTNHRYDFDNAEKHFVAALAERPRFAEAQSGYGLFLMNVRENFDSAEEHLQLALAIDPKNAVAHNSYGLLLKNVRRNFDAARLHYEAAVKADPSYANAHNNLAILLKTVDNDIEGAEKQYRLALKADPTYADAHNNLAYLLQSSSDSDEALSEAEKHYRLALEADPRYATAHNNYASLLTDARFRRRRRRHQKNDDLAEHHLRLALEANPSYADAHNSLGYLLHVARSDYDAAERHYISALKANPKHSRAHANYGLLLHVVRRDVDEAERHYRAATDADPLFATAYNNLGYLLLSARKNANAAEAEYKKALDADPSHAAANESYAELLHDIRKDFDQAELHYRTALETNPRRASAHARYGELLMDIRKDYDRAQDHFLQAIDLATKPNALRRLATIYEMKGNYKEAADYLRRYLQSQSPSLTESPAALKDKLRALETQARQQRR